MANLQDLLNQLKDEKPKKRQQAVQGLAKLGDPAAIPTLAKVYEIDKDKRVQAEAQKALTQFRAYEMTAKATSASGSSPLKTVRLILVVSLMALIAANIALQAGVVGQEDEKTVYTPSNRQALIQQVTASIFEIRQDTEALKEEWGKIGTEGGKLDCNRTFNRPRPMVLGTVDRYTYPDIVTVLSDRYQFSLDILDLSFNTWDEFCRPNNPLPPGISDSIDNSSRLNTILANLDTIEAALNTVTNNPVPTRDPKNCCTIPSGEQTGSSSGNNPIPATAVPDINSTPLPNVDYATHLAALEALVTNAEFGLNDLLARYTTIQSGAFPDCNNPPVVEAPYALPPEQSGDALLNQAVLSVNSGLSSLKQSVDIFTNNCTRNPQTALQQGVPPANTAKDQFTQARQQISDLKARSGLP
ncbi:MAG: HEAT repeat domain-containing protein [Chloroflexi bacterium]|nr:HEAT repeat domain-containing protein [Chloroflexota bacterium]